MTEQHLWEVEHDYYGPEGSFWATQAQQGPYNEAYETWADFEQGESMHGSLEGLNLLYRWDWHAWHIEYPDDYPEGTESHVLELFWMMPRKGIMARTSIKVTPADEPAVRAWLTKHALYMQKLWAPLLPLAVTV